MDEQMRMIARLAAQADVQVIEGPDGECAFQYRGLGVTGLLSRFHQLATTVSSITQAMIDAAIDQHVSAGIGRLPDQETFRRVLEAAFLAHGERAANCSWHACPEGGTWEATCGVAWEFIADGPVENRMLFCPGCGGRVQLAERVGHES